MRSFPLPNLCNNWKCPICGKNTEEPVVLIPIEGTEEEGLMQAEQFHVSCINLVYRKPSSSVSSATYHIIYMGFAVD